MAKDNRITEQELEQATREILSRNPKTGRDKLSRLLGISERRARTILDKIRSGDPVDKPVSEPISGARESFEYSQDGSIKIELNETLIHTKEQLFERCNLDPSEWEVKKLRVTAWGLGMKPPATTELHTTSAGTVWPAWVRDEKEPVKVQLYSVRAELTPRHEIIFAKTEIEALRVKAEGYAPHYPAIIFRDLKKSGNLAEYSIVDHHFGALIWGRETGYADYDTKIAKSNYEDALSTLVNRTRSHGLDEVLIVLGNDQQNADNRAGTTEKGTPQNNDGRQHKVFEVSRDVSIWAVDALREVAPIVRVVLVPGNHDYMTSWHLGDTLNSWYRNCPGVIVDNTPNPHKFYQHGNVMLMFAHGNTGKLEDYDKTMAAEHPKMWGDTKWREAHTGDKHHRRLIELKGATVRILPSLRPPCSWSAENHLVGAIRAAEAYVWNDHEGLIGTGVYSILDEKERAA